MMAGAWLASHTLRGDSNGYASGMRSARTQLRCTSRQAVGRPRPAPSNVFQLDVTSESDGTIHSAPGWFAAGFDQSGCMLAGPVPCTYSTLIDARCFAASQV